MVRSAGRHRRIHLGPVALSLVAVLTLVCGALTFPTRAAALTAPSAATTDGEGASLGVAIEIAVGGYHTCAIVDGGEVQCWGWNDRGAVGDGTTDDRTTPVRVRGLTGATAIAASFQRSCIIEGGRVHCWGKNDRGQLGDGTTTDRTIPAMVQGITGATALAAGVDYTCAIVANGEVRCWGVNNAGQLGDGTTTLRTMPVAVAGVTGATAITAELSTTCALVAGGMVRCWGANEFGQVGDGTTVARTTPTSVGGIGSATAIAAGAHHACAVVEGGEARCWGAKPFGCCGDPAMRDRTPTPVAGIADAVTISAGRNYTCVVRRNGRAACWGDNEYGELGDGTFVPFRPAVDVVGVSGILQISAGYMTTCGLSPTTGLYCWGRNDFGAVGDGSTSHRSLPTAVLGQAPPAAWIECPSTQDEVLVSLERVDTDIASGVGKSWRLSYDTLDLTFRRVANNPNALCTLRSEEGHLSVLMDLTYDGIGERQVGTSTSVATLDYLAMPAVAERCNFFGAGSRVANSCYLTDPPSAGQHTIRWSIPGFTFRAWVNCGLFVCHQTIRTTPPKDFYVTVEALPGGAGANVHWLTQAAETFIHETLIDVLPAVSRLAVFQDPPAEVLVTTPEGTRAGGAFGTERVLVEAPGSAYFSTAGGATVVLIEPSDGEHRVDLSGPPNAAFHLGFTVLDFMTEGRAPAIVEQTEAGVLDSSGHSSSCFALGSAVGCSGSGMTPAPVPLAATPSSATPPPAPRDNAPILFHSGYWVVAADGSVFGFGDASSPGNTPVGTLPAVDIEATPMGNGYWIVDSAGHVFAFGDARHAGGVDGALGGGEAVTSITRTRSGGGYWLVTTLGRVVPFGDAAFLGDLWSIRLNGPVVDSSTTPSGAGYWLVASDGGVFTFGDAAFSGSMGGTRLNAPVRSLVPDADGTGYWLVASDGGVFSFDADFHGSMGDARLNGPVAGMVGSPRGYLMVAEDGGVFTFGDAAYVGSLGATPPSQPVVGAAPILRRASGFQSWMQQPHQRSNGSAR